MTSFSSPFEWNIHTCQKHQSLSQISSESQRQVFVFTTCHPSINLDTREYDKYVSKNTAPNFLKLTYIFFNLHISTTTKTYPITVDVLGGDEKGLFLLQIYCNF